MKKTIIISLLLFLPVFLSAQEIEYNSNPTLLWDYPSVDENGDPWLPEDIISFEVYGWNTANGDITVQPIENLLYFGTTLNAEYVLTFPNRYNWAVAVRARVTDGSGETRESILSYSTVSEDSNNSPFVYAPVWQAIPLVKPTGLRDAGI